MRKSFFSIAVFSLIVFFVQPFSVRAEFYDIDNRDPLYKQIQDLEKKGVITPAPQEKLYPDNAISKAEFVEMLMRSIGVRSDSPFEIQPLTDLDGDNSRASYVFNALALGILPAGEQQFAGEQTLSRIKALNMAFKAEGLHLPIYVKAENWPYKDVNIKSWLAPTAQKAFDLKIFATGERLEPFRAITKREAINLITRLQSDRKEYPNSEAREITDSSATKLKVYNREFDEQDVPDIDVLLHVFDSIRTEYYNRAEINEKNLINGAIKGMVGILKDPYTNFAEANSNQGAIDTLSNDIEGIGAEVTEIDGAITVVSPIKGGPAEKAGLKPYDIIRSVNDIDLKGISAVQATKHIRGPAGSEVELNIERPKDKSFFRIKIRREKFEAPSVKVEYRDDIAIITISLFRGNSVNQFDVIAKEVAARKPRGLILDLRNNSGGYLDASTIISSYFLPVGDNIASIVDAKGEELIYFANGPALLTEPPMVVLINEGSASAAEIIAAALKENDRARLLGAKSFGKGSVQKLYSYLSGGEFKLTVAKWFTPKRHSIDQKGMEPDIAVTESLTDLRRGFDPQLERAFEALR